MNQSPYLAMILSKLDEVKADWKELFTAPFSISEVLDLLKSLVEAAEAVITDPGSGEDKHNAVREAFYYLDDKYHIVKMIDDAISLPFFLEPFDGAAIRGAIDLVIVAMVKIFNATIWKK